MAKKQTILSASTTTGNLTLGNYIGAINNWTKLQEEYNCYYMVANLHSLTTYQEPKVLRDRTMSFFAQYLACGLDPDKNTIFIQSHVPQHSELCWILNCIAPMGALNRMTQFKEKSAKTKEINNGLYSYPVLMAADILLYQADRVPVGEDQKQHLELTRDLAVSFNSKYSECFKLPEPHIGESGARIMSLQDPTKKMSKSDDNPKNYVSIIDTPKQISKKIKAAMTDSDPNAVIAYDLQNKRGLANLMVIYSVLSGQSYAQIEEEFQGKMYGHFKVALAEMVCQCFEPVQAKYNDLMDNQDYLLEVMKKNAERASEKAQITLDRVHSALGLIK